MQSEFTHSNAMTFDTMKSEEAHFDTEKTAYGKQTSVLSEPMKLRPHHLLCTQGFQGKGYSEDFVSNMKHYVKQMRENPDFRVTITDETDDLCSSCPNKLSQKSCRDDEKVLLFDKNVLDLFEIKSGETYSYQSLIRIIDENMTAEKMKRICGDCSWFKVSACMKNVLEKKYLLSTDGKKTEI